MAASAMKCSERRIALQRAQAILNQLIQLNETASQTEQALVAQGVASADIISTLDKILAGGGPPQYAGPTAFPESACNTISGNLFDVLNGDLTAGISWSSATEV